MHTNTLFKNIKKMAQEFNKVNKFSKSIIKYGTQISLALLFAGTIVIVLNHRVLSYNSQLVYIGTLVVRNSFIILAQAIIGGLLIDYITKKN
ncbi:UNVERIFIED_CONTAM: hypothetical protein Cloal_2038 [Acetivibrio alkalicellulosi]